MDDREGFLSLGTNAPILRRMPHPDYLGDTGDGAEGDVPDRERDAERIARRLLATRGGFEVQVRILEELSAPKTAAEISENVDVGIATVYRHLRRLEDADIVTKTVEDRRDESEGDPRGNYTTRIYTRTVDRLTFELRERDTGGEDGP